MTVLRLGTRKSALAQAQARWVADQLRQRTPELQIELVFITTSGDEPARGSKLQASTGDVAYSLQPGDKSGGLKRLFTKEIEEALLEKRIDVAVHSLKDMAADLPAGLELAAIPLREDPRDVWISKTSIAFANLPQGARIATGAVRRQAQLRHLRPDLELIAIRGNIDTRLLKLELGSYDGLILALAGLRRLDRASAVTEILPKSVMLPAIGQGALALEAREGDAFIQDMLKKIDHEPSHWAILAERAFLKTLGGSCQTPIAAFAEVKGKRIFLTGLVVHPSGNPYLRASEESAAFQAEGLGRRLAQNLLASGADQILRAL